MRIPAALVRAALVRAAIVLTVAIGSIWSADYHVSPTGDDANAGTSVEAPWASVAKVNATAFAPGDRILFEGGKTWVGTTLVPVGSGTAAARITVDVYGSGRATIHLDSPTASGLVINGNDHLTIRNLIVTGPFTIAETTAGKVPYGVHIGNDAQHIAIDRCEVSGFYGFGVLVGAGANHLSVTATDIHDNGNDGLTCEPAWDGAQRRMVTSDVRIAHCRVYNNKGWASTNSSGSGIQLRHVDGAVIEYCEAWNNGFGWGGNGGGPVGIWSWDCDNVVIQHCESHHNRNGAGGYDGAGIDIDGGDTNCVIQYCYTHDNEGCGLFIAHFAGSHPTDNNTIRSNISVNDGIATTQGAFNIWGPSTNGRIYGNVIIGGRDNSNGIFRNDSPSAGPGQKVWNNIFVSTNGKPLVAGVGNGEFAFQGNLYFATDGAYDINGHTSLAAWRAAGQEMLDGVPVGVEGNPRFVAMTEPGTVTVANLVSALAGYRLDPSSPAIDAGLDLAARFAIDPGARDYFGGTRRQGDGFDIGAHETARSSVIAVTPSHARVAVGYAITLSGRAYDAGGSLISPPPPLTWEAAGGGTITAGGAFTATAVGPATVTVSGGGLTGSATVSVVHPDGGGTGILREWWTGLGGGGSVASLLTDTDAFARAPTGSEVIGGAFEAPRNLGDGYGQRLRGRFWPPASGDHTFVIASDDASELWLSTDGTAANAVKIASVLAWTGPREWTKEANQTSVAIPLVAGRGYFIEARHKEGGGGDHLAVGVTLPGGVVERPIPFHRLTP